MTHAIDIDALTKNFGRTTALDGVSCSVTGGEIFGLLGPNGAGKTTLVSIIAGLTDATSGTARVLGQPPGEARRMIGLATQDLALYADLTARENLRFFGKLYGLSGRELSSRVDEVLAAVGLTDRADRRAATFSGGMKRRLNLGIAIVHRPRVLLLDEPTTGVDPQSRNHIFGHVRELHRQGVTVIYSSHYMEEVQALCPRIAILDHGRLIACDGLSELLGRMNGTIELDFTEPVPGLTDRLRTLPGIGEVRADGKTITLASARPGESLPGVMTALHQSGTEPKAVRVREPNLEQVFLHLTGQGLRDD